MSKRDTLLIVDDMEVNRAILRSLFERQYNILEAENGEQALILLNQYQEHLAAMLLDLVMPVRDGYEVMEQMRRSSLLSRVPVIVITSDDTTESEMRTFDLGASDIIMKPFEPHIVKRRVQNIVDLYRHKLNLEDLVEEQSASLKESNSIMIDALSSIIEYRSLESGQHVRRIRMFTRILLEDVARSYQEYNLDERLIGVIADASSMHDIGKIAIPDSILCKPGPLTKEEFEVMKTHTLKGCGMLSHFERLNDKEYINYAYNICRYHHERWDGKGYPDGLKGDSIPICAQVVAIADCYDALTTDRVYKKAITPDQAFIMILNGECGAFSPRLLECFKNVKNEFARLSRAYTDGEGPADLPMERELLKSMSVSDTVNTLEQGQMKYFTLLRYVDSTVMEVDVNTGVYHMVYMPDPNFEQLRSGACFEETLRNFSEGSVYSGDRELVSGLPGKFMDEFFRDGLMRWTGDCRVLDGDSGDYRWYRMDLLRVEIDDPRQRRIILIWHPFERGKEAAPLHRPEDSQNQGIRQLMGPGSAHAADFCFTPQLSIREEVINRLVGGILRLANDRWLTMREINRGFCDLLSCTEEEIRNKYHGRYMEMVYRDDREKLRQDMAEQLRVGRFATSEYRMTAGNGRLIWVLDRRWLVTDSDGSEYFCSILIDITESRQIQEELQLSLERHRIILDQTNDVIFEWNIDADTLSLSNNWEKKYGYEPITEMLSERLPLASHVNPDDIHDAMKLMKAVKDGQSFGEVEFRLADGTGRYAWRKVRVKTQFNSQGKPIKAIGIITDIDDEKRATQLLQEKAERDVLTKLYNKKAARSKILQYLKMRSEDDVSALLIIDVDNFKMVNDTYGHMFGDAVLTELAARVSSLFRDTDIVSRIGGDEFMVFMPGVPSEEIVRDRADRMIESFQNMLKDSLKELPFSCSIGISYAPLDGSDFQTLFQNGDAALYQAKLRGKNRYVEYKRETAGQAFGSKEADAPITMRMNLPLKNEINMSTIIGMTFRELYEAGDFEKAVGGILEMIGVLFEVSRVYIFESTGEDDSLCRGSFEWCREGITPWREIEPCFSYKEMAEDYRNNFDDDGIFYCPDIWSLSEEQRDFMKAGDVLSVLQCAIQDEGKFKGFIGLDECSSRRIWTQEQIDCLSFLSKMLSVFLLKKRAQDEVMKSVQNLQALLDSLNSSIYVIDQNTYEVLYINKKTQVLSPEAEIGKPCYQTFLGFDKPCDRCPAREGGEEGNSILEVYNPKEDMWILAAASDICWGERAAYLLVCQDISQYKEKKPEASESDE